MSEKYPGGIMIWARTSCQPVLQKHPFPFGFFCLNVPELFLTLMKLVFKGEIVVESAATDKALMAFTIGSYKGLI